MGSEMLFLGPKQEKMTKSNFTQTCNRFSQFLKEKRSLAHLDAFKSTIVSSPDLEIIGAKEVSGPKNTAINLFPENMEKESVSLELFPLMSAAGSEDSTKKNMADCRELSITKEEPKTTTTPSMTIFYGGRVLVFNELPEDKAREIMSLARIGTMCSTSQSPTARDITQTPRSVNTIASHLTQDYVVPQGVACLADLPIARRVSLHRFIEKRKHRMAASAPYQLQNLSMATMADSHPHKFNMMRGLLEQQQLELKL